MLASREGWLQVWASHITSSSSPRRSSTSVAKMTAQGRAKRCCLLSLWGRSTKLGPHVAHGNSTAKQAVHQAQEKLNLSFLCRAFQHEQPPPHGSVCSEELCSNGIKKLFTAWIALQCEDPKSTDGKQDNSSCRGSRIVCGTKWPNNDSGHFKPGGTHTPTLRAPGSVSAWLGPHGGSSVGLSVLEGSRGDREQEQSFSQANLNCEPQGWRLNSHEELLKPELPQDLWLSSPK